MSQTAIGVQSTIDLKLTHETTRVNPVPGSSKSTDEKKKIYRNFGEFYDCISLDSACSFSFGIRLNEVRIAKEKRATRSVDPAYSDTYHIAFRHGEFHAQIDKAFSELHKFFLGYGPDIDIIQDGNDFYTASRTIHNLVHDFKGFTIAPDGKISKQIEGGKKTIYFTLKYLASFVAIAYFFGQSDIHSGNWGVQENGEELRVYKIDDPNALDIEMLSTPLSTSLMVSLGFPFEDLKEQTDSKQSAETDSVFHFSLSSFLKTREFKDELKSMFIKIAQTQFQSIKEILQKHITADPAEAALWDIHIFKPLFNKNPKQLSDDTGKNIEECIEFLKGLQECLDAIKNPEHKRAIIQQCSLANRLELLEARHKQLQVIVDRQPDLTHGAKNSNSNEKAIVQNQKAVIGSVAPLTPLYNASMASDNKTSVADRLPGASNIL